MLNLQILDSTMSREMLELVVYSTVRAFRQTKIFKEVAEIIKTTMDTVSLIKGYDWQVVVGERFGSYVTSGSEGFAFFTVHGAFVLIFLTKSCDDN